MSYDALEIVSSINASLAASKDGRANVQGVLDTLRDHFRFSSCFLILEKRDDGRLSISAASGLTISEFRKIDTQADHGVFRKVFETADPMVVALDKSDLHLDFEVASQSKLITSPV